MRQRKCLLILYCLLLVMLLMGCGRSSKKNEEAAPEQASTEISDSTGEIDDIMMENLIDRALKKMTLEQKIGQLFVVCTDSLDFDAEKEMTKKAAECLKTYQPGGIIFFSFNLKDRDQTKKFITDMQSLSGVPLFIAVDEEGGRVSRIANTKEMNTTSLAPMREIGDTSDPEQARLAGQTIGKDIGELGFNLDFAPVADITTNDTNTEIGDRSFGNDPDLVADMVSAFVEGIQEENVCATLKHFPGQGDTGEDTHLGFVNLDTSIDRLRKVEFVPFEAGIGAGADLVMVSHVAVSNITQNQVPASLSSLMVRDILREELQFEQIVITDAMNMKVITKFYDPAQAAVMAIQAGNDMVLMPDDFVKAYEGVLDAVKEGDLSEKAVDEAVGRILTVKIRRGIIPLDSDLLK